MTCPIGSKMHENLKNYGQDFVEFWHEYFRSTGKHVRDLPIKHFLSAMDLLNVRELWMCKCDDIIEKLYPVLTCADCDRTFSTNKCLKVHKCWKLEQNYKSFECMLCDKSYSSKKWLQRHLERHTKEYKCEVCNQTLHQIYIGRHETTKKHLNNLKKMKLRKTLK